MVSQGVIDWIERLVWILVYGGLFFILVGVLTGREDEALGLALTLAGGAAVAIGALLIWVRSRVRGPGDITKKGKP